MAHTPRKHDKHGRDQASRALILRPLKSAARKKGFTSETALPCFGRDSGFFLPLPVNQPSSRKQFFAKLLGAAAAASVLPKTIAGESSPVVAPVAGQPVPARKLEIRAEARAVARRDMI